MAAPCCQLVETGTQAAIQDPFFGVQEQLISLSNRE
jgi:hypothetical protein